MIDFNDSNNKNAHIYNLFKKNYQYIKKNYFINNPYSPYHKKFNPKINTYCPRQWMADGHIHQTSTNPSYRKNSKKSQTRQTKTDTQTKHKQIINVIDRSRPRVYQPVECVSRLVSGWSMAPLRFSTLAFLEFGSAKDE